MRVVLVHDWLLGMRGGERVLEHLCRLFPQAPIYTLFQHAPSLSELLRSRHVVPSWLNRLPAVRRYYRWLLPLFPRAVEGLRLPDADLVISCSHCVAKAVQVPSEATHICYCLTPVRYLWHQQDAYFSTPTSGLGVWRFWSSPIGRAMLACVLERLRQWDQLTADRVHYFLAISQTVRRRIRDCYGREATVIWPPVDVEYYRPLRLPREPFYLSVGAVVPYKRVDLAIRACRLLGRPLVVVGKGPEFHRLRRLAGAETVFVGWVSERELLELYNRCRALLFPALEDFGLVPVEAQACGSPVIAFGAGGASETVIPLGGAASPTGVWFHEQTVESLAEAILLFEKNQAVFDPWVARRNAERFSAERFRAEFLAAVRRAMRPPAPARAA